MRKPPEPPPPADRRRSLRAPLIVQRVRVGDESQPFFGYAKNISRGGLFIGATIPRDPGSRFRLSIPMPEPLSRTITCSAEVVWSRTRCKDFERPPGMGLRFLDLPDEEAEAIDRWLERAVPRHKK